MLRRFVPLTLVLATACASYESDYRPPADGRARALFEDNHVVMSVDTSNAACLDAADQEARVPTYRYVRHGGGGASVGVIIWAPPPVVVVGPAPVYHPHPVPARTPAHGGIGSALGGGASHGGKNDAAKEAYIAVAVAILVASPFIAYGLVASRPEPEEEVSETIDRVNAYNDVARSPGSPCFGPPNGGQGGPLPPEYGNPPPNVGPGVGPQVGPQVQPQPGVQ